MTGSRYTPADAPPARSDELDAAAIRSRLPAVWDVRVAWTIDSTNTALLARVRADATHDRPLLVAAENQEAGRGRLGRRWRSAPSASLTLSVALPVDRPLAALDGITLVCGLAVRDAVSRHGARPTLKWPNDLLVDGRKLGGILVEAHVPQHRPRTTVLVVGVGLNVRPLGPDPQTDDAAADRTADLASSGAPLVDRNALAADLALALADRLAAFATAGFGAFAGEWNAADAFHDRPVRVGAADDLSAGRAAVGIARGVDDTGALRLDVGGRVQRVVAGDVSLRPLDDGVDA